MIVLTLSCPSGDWVGVIFFLIQKDIDDCSDSVSSVTTTPCHGFEFFPPPPLSVTQSFVYLL